jgi:putative spermidine/putrescine transport system ATP-binding protein
LVNRPKVLLLDEPLGALDLKLREEMQVELKTIQRDVGITFVFVTHDQGEALSMSSRVAVFNHGRIEQVGTPREIYDHPATMFVAGFVGTSNLLPAQLSQDLFGVFRTHSVRPERIRIVQQTVSDVEVSVEGTVDDVQYLGADCRVRVRLADGTHLLASVPSDGLVGVAVGGTARLAWPRFAAFEVAETTTSEGGDQ